MIFTSLHFVVFFAVVYALYRVLPHRWQNWMLLAASYYFYGSWDWRFLSLLLGSTIVDFLVGRYLGRQLAPGRRRLALILSLIFNFGMLGFFKYFNFFEESLVAIGGVVGWHFDPFTLNVILPIGISFYTFMTVSYVIDVYRRQIQPTTHPLDFALVRGVLPASGRRAHPAGVAAPAADRAAPHDHARSDRERAVAHRLGLLPEDVRRRQPGAARRHRVRAVRDAPRRRHPGGGLGVRLPDLRRLRRLLEHRARHRRS